MRLAGCQAVFARLSGDGRRVLAVAYRWFAPRAAYRRSDECDLVLAGFVSFSDPVLGDAAAAQMARDSVAVKILTGDNELVARHVCKRVEHAVVMALVRCAPCPVRTVRR